MKHECNNIMADSYAIERQIVKTRDVTNECDDIMADSYAIERQIVKLEM
jgi:hypothetical protein